MKRFALGLSVLALGLLAACGGPQLTAQQILDKMHERFVTMVTEQTQKVQTPLLAETNTAIALQTQPIADMFPGAVNAEFTGKQSVDVTDAKKPKFDAVINLNVSASAPGELFGIPPAPGTQGVMQQASAAVAANIRSINSKVFLNIANVLIRQPGKSEVTLDKKVAAAWYMATFEEINKMIADNMAGEDPNAVPPTIESLIEKSVAQYQNSTKEIQELVKGANIWKPVELLPDEDGMYRVRVEADKQKFVALLDKLMESAMRQNDPTGTNAAMQAQMEEAKLQMHADVEKMGGLKGILMADKDTFQPRGFAGQVTDSGGIVQLDIDILARRNGDGHIKLSNPKDATENVVFDKKGEAFTLTAEGTKIADGTWSEKKFTMTAYQETATLLSADFAIASATEDRLDITGKIVIPGAGAEIVFETFKLSFSNSYKDMLVDLSLHASLLGSPAIDLTINSERKEVKSVTVEEPAVAKPFSTMEKDFGPLLQALSQ